jgi:hypothetical protein
MSTPFAGRIGIFHTLFSLCGSEMPKAEPLEKERILDWSKMASMCAF